MLHCAGFSPDSARLATYGDKGIRVWDLAKREPRDAGVEFLPATACGVQPGRGMADSRPWRGQRGSWTPRRVEWSECLKGHSGMIPRWRSAGWHHRRSWPPGALTGTVRLWGLSASPSDATAVSRPELELRLSNSRPPSSDGRSLLAIELRDERKRVGCGTPRLVGCEGEIG